MPQVKVLRVYDNPKRIGEEYRVLVDRLWPRSLRKEALDLDEWMKDVAPSTELRRWYGHVPERFKEFTDRYKRELSSGTKAEALEHLRHLANNRQLVLLTATRDVEYSAAAVLYSVLESGSMSS